ncbi:MAG: murein hydrolase activator EnvC family protein [Flavobacteriaceae bacterium]
MSIRNIRLRRLFCWGLILLSTAVLGQRQQELEAQRKRLQQEIKQINTLLFQNKKQQKNTLGAAEDLQVRIQVRERLIRVTHEEINWLGKRILNNERDIDRTRKELQQLRDDYEQIIRKSYAARAQQNKLLFIFSSESFLQAYKRIQYLKQYANFRRQQGLKIEEKTVLLQQLNTELREQRKNKERLLTANNQVKATLEKERQQKNALQLSLKRKAKVYTQQIQTKQKQADALNKAIQKLIREAIAASNQSAGKKKGDAFSLTPEAKELAANFVSNKGRLPWPVAEGVVIQGFGTQPHPVVKTTMIKSNGVSIACPKGSQARAIFKGEVMSILSFKGSNPTVLVRHGNYITAYKNLAEVYVEKGDRVEPKQALGMVFSNPQTGKTVLQFSVFRELKPQNPKSWLYRL